MMRLVDAVPDATPPPGARERVRAALRDRVERTRRRRALSAYAGVAAAAGVAVALVAVLQMRATPGDAPPYAAPLGTGVIELSSQARVFVPDDARLALVRDDATGTVIRLDRGSVLANVAKRAPGRPFVVLALDVRVEVVGTVFAVGITRTGIVGVRGYDGTVRVVHGGGEARVGAGDAWPAPALAPVIDDAALRRIRTAPRTTATAIDEDRPSAHANGDARGSDTTAPAANVRARANVAPAPSASATARSNDAATVSSGRRFAAARRLEETGDVAAALAAYRAIEAGPEAEDAQYAIGRLQLTADPEAARTTFAAYRQHYPRGRYARVVDLHVLELARARRDDAATEAEADRFLAEHADDPLAPRFREARAAVRARRGDCAGARADVDALPSSPATVRLLAGCPR